MPLTARGAGRWRWTRREAAPQPRCPLYRALDLEARGRRIVEKFEKQVGRLVDVRNPIGSSHLDASELTARVHQLERRIDQLERELRDMIEQPGA